MNLCYFNSSILKHYSQPREIRNNYKFTMNLQLCTQCVHNLRTIRRFYKTLSIRYALRSELEKCVLLFVDVN
jgi:hypothetical protein